MSEYRVTQEDDIDQCSHCGRRYHAFRGDVWRAGQWAGRYLAGMHQCGEHPRAVALTVWIVDPRDETGSAVWSELVSNAGDHYNFRVLDALWPWQLHDPAGRVMTRAEVRELAPALGLFDLTGNLMDNVPHLEHFLNGRGDGWLPDDELLSPAGAGSAGN